MGHQRVPHTGPEGPGPHGPAPVVRGGHSLKGCGLGLLCSTEGPAGPEAPHAVGAVGPGRQGAGGEGFHCYTPLLPSFHR